MDNPQNDKENERKIIESEKREDEELEREIQKMKEVKVDAEEEGKENRVYIGILAVLFVVGLAILLFLVIGMLNEDKDKEALNGETIKQARENIDKNKDEETKESSESSDPFQEELAKDEERPVGETLEDTEKS